MLPAVPKDYRPSTTPWNELDFRGTWPIDHLNGTPMQRDPAQGDRPFLTDEEYRRAQHGAIEAAAARMRAKTKAAASARATGSRWAEPSRRTSLLVSPANGRFPEMTPEGARLSAQMRSSWRQEQAFDWTSDFDSWDRCITRGMPASMLPMQYNNGIRVFQAPGLVAIQLEMIHEVRLIPTDGRAPVPTQIHNWMEAGESRAHWERTATRLVIETGNFRPGPSATNIVTTGSPPRERHPDQPARRGSWSD